MKNDGLMEIVREREMIYPGKVVHLEKWQVELPDGRMATREVVQHVGAVAVVACDAQGNVATVLQCRVALGRVMEEIPAGKLDSVAEDHLQAAQRELQEETGLVAGNWLHMADVVTTPGFCDEVISLYLATDLTRGETHFDEDEFLHIRMTPYGQLVDKIYQGELHDQKTLCALLMARRYLEDMHLI